jgi:hypothetical protein
MTSTRSDAAAEAMREACRKIAADCLAGASTDGGRYVAAYIIKQIRALQVPATVESGETECPDCNGSGGRMISEAGCCNNPTRTGECCGNAIEVPGTEQCSTCGGSGKWPGPSDTPALEQAEPVAAIQWLHRDPVGGFPIWKENQFWNGVRSSESRDLYAQPQAVDAEAIAKIIDEKLSRLDLGCGDEVNIADAIAHFRREDSLSVTNDILERFRNDTANAIARLLAGGAKP